jgi:hypothetical protein
MPRADVGCMRARSGSAAAGARTGSDVRLFSDRSGEECSGWEYALPPKWTVAVTAVSTAPAVCLFGSSDGAGFLSVATPGSVSDTQERLDVSIGSSSSSEYDHERVRFCNGRRVSTSQFGSVDCMCFAVCIRWKAPNGVSHKGRRKMERFESTGGLTAGLPTPLPGDCRWTARTTIPIGLFRSPVGD